LMSGRSWNWPTDYRLTKYERDMLSAPGGVRSLGLSYNGAVSLQTRIRTERVRWWPETSSL